jgi:hypothetical protein
MIGAVIALVLGGILSWMGYRDLYMKFRVVLVECPKV